MCYLEAASKHLTFGFRHGTLIDDPILVGSRGPGSVMAHTKPRSPVDIDEVPFAAWLRQAHALELATD